MSGVRKNWCYVHKTSFPKCFIHISQVVLIQKGFRALNQCKKNRRQFLQDNNVHVVILVNPHRFSTTNEKGMEIFRIKYVCMFAFLVLSMKLDFSPRTSILTHFGPWILQKNQWGFVPLHGENHLWFEKKTTVFLKFKGQLIEVRLIPIFTLKTYFSQIY